MALTQDRESIVSRGDVRRKAYLMAPSTTIYKQAKVMLNAAGLAVPAARAVGNHGVVGVAEAGVVSDASTPTYVYVLEGEFELPGVFTQAAVGTFAYAVDDEDVQTDAAAGPGDPCAGWIKELAAGGALVRIDPALNAQRGPHA